MIFNYNSSSTKTSSTRSSSLRLASLSIVVICFPSLHHGTNFASAASAAHSVPTPNIGVSAVPSSSPTLTPSSSPHQYYLYRHNYNNYVNDNGNRNGGGDDVCENNGSVFNNTVVSDRDRLFEFKEEDNNHNNISEEDGDRGNENDDSIFSLESWVRSSVVVVDDDDDDMMMSSKTSDGRDGDDEDEASTANSVKAKLLTSVFDGQQRIPGGTGVLSSNNRRYATSLIWATNFI